MQLVAQPRFPDPAAAVAHGLLVAPMPGLVLRIGAAVGDTVTAGQPLIWTAMKMEHTVTAPGDGVLVNSTSSRANRSTSAPYSPVLTIPKESPR